jgi:hypothetical protein
VNARLAGKFLLGIALDRAILSDSGAESEAVLVFGGHEINFAESYLKVYRI